MRISDWSSDVCSSDLDKLASPLALALGKDISGRPAVVDLARMPHLLVAGTTGSGKSVCPNAMVLSMLYKDRKNVVEGKSGSVRVELGGRRIIKHNTQQMLESH